MNKQLNVSFKLVIFAALLFFVVGCASTSTPTPSTPSLVGTWVTTVTEAQAPAPGWAGQYEVTFADNGRVSLYNRAGMGLVSDMGTYSITEDRVLFTDDRSECLRNGFKTGTYKWSIENDTLTLTAIDDLCYTRRKSAEVGTWTRKTAETTPFPTIKPMLK